MRNWLYEYSNIKIKYNFFSKINTEIVRIVLMLMYFGPSHSKQKWTVREGSDKIGDNILGPFTVSQNSSLPK